MDPIPTPPVLDEELIRLAITLADGARIHVLHAEVGSYRNSVIFSQTLARRIYERGPQGDDLECLQARIAAANKYETILRHRIAAARLGAVPTALDSPPESVP